MKINIKVLAAITIVLIVALIAINLFVPKHITTDGRVVTFKKSSTPQTTPTPTPVATVTEEEIVE